MSIILDAFHSILTDKVVQFEQYWKLLLVLYLSYITIFSLYLFFSSYQMAFFQLCDELIYTAVLQDGMLALHQSVATVLSGKSYLSVATYCWTTSPLLIVFLELYSGKINELFYLGWDTMLYDILRWCNICTAVLFLLIRCVIPAF